MPAFFVFVKPHGIRAHGIASHASLSETLRSDSSSPKATKDTPLRIHPRTYPAFVGAGCYGGVGCPWLFAKEGKKNYHKDMTHKALVDQLVADGYLKTELVIEAFRAVDRAHFVEKEGEPYAYENHPLPIGYGQTISQPLTVAFMLELLQPQPGETILDIGCGSGWQTALLAYCVGAQGSVTGIERIPELKEFAERNIATCESIPKEIIRLEVGDGTLGFPDSAPFDKIIAAAAAHAIPETWKAQLKVGGRIVAPVEQSVFLLEKKSQDEFEEKRFFGFSFVPLVSGE